MGNQFDTLFVNPRDITRTWYLIDARDRPLGRVAARVATLLRGKHRPWFTPHQEVGDYVVVINARHARLTGRKREQKTYYRHSGYPGGLKSATYDKVVARKPVFPMEQAVRGMLPKGPLGRKLFGNVKIYADAEHPHAAQQPEELPV
jgi:large subunit ribosomal protein L13